MGGFLARSTTEVSTESGTEVGRITAGVEAELRQSTLVLETVQDKFRYLYWLFSTG